MRAVFLSMLAASLLIHAALGCCWHHGHDASGCIDSRLVLATEADCGHGHSDTAKGHGSHGPCRGHSHCGGTCNYLPAKNTQVGKCQLDVPVDFARAGVALGRLEASFRFAERSGEFAIRPPLRLHLLHQILLI